MTAPRPITSVRERLLNTKLYVDRCIFWRPDEIILRGAFVSKYVRMGATVTDDLRDADLALLDPARSVVDSAIRHFPGPVISYHFIHDAYISVALPDYRRYILDLSLIKPHPDEGDAPFPRRSSEDTTAYPPPQSSSHSGPETPPVHPAPLRPESTRPVPPPRSRPASPVVSEPAPRSSASPSAPVLRSTPASSAVSPPAPPPPLPRPHPSDRLHSTERRTRSSPHVPSPREPSPLPPLPASRKRQRPPAARDTLTAQKPSHPTDPPLRAALHHPQPPNESQATHTPSTSTLRPSIRRSLSPPESHPQAPPPTSSRRRAHPAPDCPLPNFRLPNRCRYSFQFPATRDWAAEVTEWVVLHTDYRDLDIESLVFIKHLSGILFKLLPASLFLSSLTSCVAIGARGPEYRCRLIDVARAAQKRRVAEDFVVLDEAALDTALAKAAQLHRDARPRLLLPPIRDPFKPDDDEVPEQPEEEEEDELYESEEHQESDTGRPSKRTKTAHTRK
ncbi:hypothetical protein AURDEDRAFT_125159 [Auricularia subglabra TFB-10046 SS5]|uniref:Uncharacterized protein n=1 Tax=Auricularia subglabra (strain TFB-10046 / SS5) TaxID=717982 RepID=J0DDS0_AURST|nr:hypothetical protein AURDEDRAFT_125159 [Auricularia subglabra TFB-10046 SS5]